MYFLCSKDRFGNLLDLILWYSNAFVMNLVVSLKLEWPHPPRTCQNTDGWLLRYLAVVYKLHFPWYFNLNKEWKVDEPLFVPKQNSKEWQQQKQPVNHIDFQPTTAENCFQKMKEKKCNTQQICSRGWVSHSFSGKELTFPRLSFAHLCGSSSSGLEIEVGGLQCVSCSRSNGLFKQIAPILGIDSWMEQVEVQVFFLHFVFSPDSDSIAIGVLTSNRGGGRRTTLGGLDVAPGCHCRLQWTLCHCTTLRSNGIQKKRPEKLPWASCRPYTVLYIDNTKNDFCYLGSMLV